jgi:hypothetical protein
MIRLPVQSFRAPRLALVAALGLFAGPVIAGAQDAGPQAPAHISYVEGRVTVESDAGTALAEDSTPVVPGDRVRTETGRAELLFGDGSLVQFDEQTSLDVLSDDRLRLLSGRIAIVATSALAGRLQVDTPQGSVEIRSAGEYRVLLFEDEGRATVEASVIRGSADLASDRDRVTIEAGERSWARLGEAPAYPVRFNAAAFDAFDQWALDRAGSRRESPSVQYVPTELHAYADVFDTYGAWGYQPTYGHVWYPRVAPGWRPYYSGGWRYYGRFGWTWVGGGAWGWPTHHYGRWGVSTAGSWFWIPGAVWGPAWVSWAVAPGYVSWCPLGFDNRPVIGWGHGGFGHHGDRGHGHGRWHGWTVVPRDHFGGSRSVSASAVDGTRFAANRSQPNFVQQDRAPQAPRGSSARGGYGLGVAIPRGASVSSAAVSSATAPPGSGTRRYTAGSSLPPPAAPVLTAPGRQASSTTPRSSSPGRGTITRRADPTIERTPEDLARGSRLATPRNATRLPGDAGRRTLPAAPGATNVPGAVSTLPGSRAYGVAPRAGGASTTRPWSPDQVPVHRGMPMQPDAGRMTAAPASPGAIGTWRGDRVQPPAGASVGGAGRGSIGNSSGVRTPGSPGMAMPRGGAVGPRSAPSSMPAYRVGPPPSAPPAAAPPPAAAGPRQAPSGSRGGTAAPRGGASSGHHR